MRLHRDERGQTIILVALSLPLMLGFVGIATDVGALFQARRDIQTAADAAAIAGALNYNRGYAAWQSAAYTAASNNGFTNGSNGVTVTVPQTPQWPYSNYKGKTPYVEVTITAPESTIFLTLFGHPSVTVLARAVANSQAQGTGCLYTVGATGTTFTANNATLNGTSTTPACGLTVESNGTPAMVANNSTITLASIGVVGGVSNSGSTISPAPIAGIAPASDPLNYLPQYSFTTTTNRRGRSTYHVECAAGYDCSDSPITVPTTCASTGGGVYNATAGTTLTPGCYANLTFPSGGTVTLDPGLYIVDGDLTFGAGNVNGSGVTLYYSGNLILGSGVYTLSAPNDPSQTFNGILFAEDISDTDNILFNGGAGTTLQGIIYAPGTPLTLTGTPSITLDTDLVAQQLTLSGAVNLTNYASLSGIQSPLSSVALVE